MTVFIQNPADRPLRANFSFCVDGLSPRDELLFKSLIRLLNHRTEHGWFYTPNSRVEQVDLRVVSDDAATLVLPLPPPSFQGVLKLSAVARTAPGTLLLPLLPEALEAELNRQGQLVNKTRTALAMAASSGHAAARAHAPAGPKMPSPLSPPMGDRPFKLYRWPPQHLINTPARLRLATLMVSRPVTLMELAHKTGQPLTVCIDFANDLWRANLISDSDVVTSFDAPSAPKPNQPTELAIAKTPAAVPMDRGLFARIRSRLGL